MEETFRLPDGRTLGYLVTGAPDGVPAFYFHGFPGSRLEATLAGALPMRLIGVDRPGYGLSSPLPGRRLVDWPADVLALSDHLGLGRFRVIGVSGGAPYALACAAALDRVSGVALISPVPPLARGVVSERGLSPFLRRLRWLGEHPGLGQAILTATWLALRAGVFNPAWAMIGSTVPRDEACLTPQLRRRLVAAWREGFWRGVDGMISDAEIYVAPFGFALSAISVPVMIWHGGADVVVPAGALAAYDGLGWRREVLPEEGHYSVAVTRVREIMAAMAGGGR